MMRSQNNGPKHQTFAGYDDATRAAKKLGANAPGEFGGIYKSTDGENTAIFKCDTLDDGTVRHEKVIAEFVAGQLMAAMMHELHPDEPDYADKLIAKVGLARANPAGVVHYDPDNLIYLQSIFLRNYGGDFWEWAFARKPREEIIQKYKIYSDSQLRKSHPEYTDDEINTVVAERVEELQSVFDKMARKNVAEKNPKGKPKAVLAALMKNFSADAISIPSNALLDNPRLLTDFCDQAAARILVSDYGIHPGNFGIVPKDGHDRLASLDYGAGLKNLFPDAALFSRSKKETGTKFYKNHLLEYDPRVIKSTQMARALIKLGDLTNDFFARQADIILTTANIPYSPAALMKFCKHLGMDSSLYADKNTSDELLVTAKNFLVERLKARRNSMLHQGYGLLYELCINDSGEINTRKLTKAKQDFPGFAEFIKNDLRDYKFVLHKDLSLKSRPMRGYTLSLPTTPTTYGEIEQDIFNKIDALKKSVLPPESKDKLIEDIQSKIDTALYSPPAPSAAAREEHITRLTGAIEQINLIPDTPTLEPFLHIQETQVFTGDNSLNEARQAAFAFIKNKPDDLTLVSGSRKLDSPEGETNRFIGTNFQPKPRKPAQVPIAFVQTTNAEKTFTRQTAYMPPGGLKELDQLPFFTRDKIAKIREQMRFVCNLVETSMAAIQANGPVTISDWGENLSRAAAVYCHYMGYEFSSPQYTQKIPNDQMIRLIGDFQNQIEADPALKTYIEEAKARRDIKISSRPTLRTD